MTSDGKQVAATDADAWKGRYCPACGARVSLVRAYDKINHFRHQPNSASAGCPLYDPHDGYWTGGYIGSAYDRPIPPWSDNKSVVTYPEKQKRGIVASSTFNPRFPLFLGQRLLMLSIISIVLLVVGSQVIASVQAGIAQIDWGGLVLQCIGGVIVVIAATVAISIIGGLLMAVITFVGTLLGIAFVCGLITSLIFHWPWAF